MNSNWGHKLLIPIWINWNSVSPFSVHVFNDVRFLYIFFSHFIFLKAHLAGYNRSIFIYQSNASCILKFLSSSHCLNQAHSIELTYKSISISKKQKWKPQQQQNGKQEKKFKQIINANDKRVNFALFTIKIENPLLNRLS